MTITTKHARSSYGLPVILNDAGKVVDQVPGLLAILERLGWTRATLAERCGVSSRTVESWLQEVDVPPGRKAPRRPIPAESLNVLADALHDLGS